MFYDCVSYVSLQHCKRKDDGGDDDGDDIDTDVLCVHDIVILYGSVCYTVINTCVEKRREAEHRAMKELERELKEAKEREKEVSMIMSIRNLYAHTLGSSPYV